MKKLAGLATAGMLLATLSGCSDAGGGGVAGLGGAEAASYDASNAVHLNYTSSREKGTTPVEGAEILIPFPAERDQALQENFGLSPEKNKIYEEIYIKSIPKQDDLCGMEIYLKYTPQGRDLISKFTDLVGGGTLSEQEQYELAIVGETYSVPTVKPTPITAEHSMWFEQNYTKLTNYQWCDESLSNHTAFQLEIPVNVEGYYQHLDSVDPRAEETDPMRVGIVVNEAGTLSADLLSGGGITTDEQGNWKVD